MKALVGKASACADFEVHYMHIAEKSDLILVVAADLMTVVANRQPNLTCPKHQAGLKEVEGHGPEEV